MRSIEQEETDHSTMGAGAMKREMVFAALYSAMAAAEYLAHLLQEHELGNPRSARTWLHDARERLRHAVACLPDDHQVT